MSHAATAWAMTAKCESSTEKAILFVVAEYVGQDGACYPSHKTISERACCSTKSVVRALASFEERGIIMRRARRRKDGSRTSDLIIWTATDNPEQFEEQVDTESVCETKRTHSPVQTDTVSHLTTFEPATEPVSFKNIKNPNRFEEFWSNYPRKSAKAPAKTAYAKALKKTDHETLVRATDNQKRSRDWLAGFIPHASTWLNQERWDDECEPSDGPRMAGKEQTGGRGQGSGGFAAIAARRKLEREQGMAFSDGGSSVSGGNHDWADGAIDGDSWPSFGED